VPGNRHNFNRKVKETHEDGASVETGKTEWRS